MTPGIARPRIDMLGISYHAGKDAVLRQSELIKGFHLAAVLSFFSIRS